MPSCYPKNKKPPAAFKSNSRMRKSMRLKSFDDRLNDWVVKNKEMGVPDSKLYLPFLPGQSKLKLADCRVCENVIYPGEGVLCSMSGCKVSYHSKCASKRFGELKSSKEIKCPQHVCFLCNKISSLLRCSICDLASHDKCAAYPEYMIRFEGNPRKMVCWRHSTDSLPLKNAVPTSSIEEVFCRLPLPYVPKELNIDHVLRVTKVQPKNPVIDSIKEFFRHLPLPNVEEEFKCGLIKKHTKSNNFDSSSYVQIKQNIYLTKKKRYKVDDAIGCPRCSSKICNDDCECRSTQFSCSIECRCSERCTNREPFQEGKKVKVVMTQNCGWGVEADEFINKDDFIIEYVGEVISDALCEKRFRNLKQKGAAKFYVVEIRKDFNIDAMFKGNEARFVNHGCDPNCSMEQWDVNGETRLGIFAIKSIQPGEQLTFDYRFQQFGSDTECQCGASNCHGYLGNKKVKTVGLGAKRRRSATN